MTFASGVVITGLGGRSQTLDTVFAEAKEGTKESTAVQLCLNLGRKLEEADRDIIDEAMRSMMAELHARSVMLIPENVQWKKDWIAKAVECFRLAGLDPISFQEIPNEYCGPKCCPHRVWLLMSTAEGIFKVGWRKRVMELDWRNMKGPWDREKVKKLFEKEDVTKGEYFIHAWSYEKLVEYLKLLVSQPVNSNS